MYTREIKNHGRSSKREISRNWVKANWRDISSHSTRLLAASTLRTVLGTRNLAEILSERETISHTMQTSLDEATEPWGVKVERVEM